MLKKIKMLLGINNTDKDELLDLLIDLTTDEVKNYCNLTDISTMDSTIIQMIIYKFNRIGTEGLQSENYSGASYSYLNEYPSNIIAMLNKSKRVRCL